MTSRAPSAEGKVLDDPGGASKEPWIEEWLTVDDTRARGMEALGLVLTPTTAMDGYVGAFKVRRWQHLLYLHAVPYSGIDGSNVAGEVWKSVARRMAARPDHRRAFEAMNFLVGARTAPAGEFLLFLGTLA